MDMKNRGVTWLVSQFGHPTGIAGRLAGWEMAVRPSNRQRNTWAVELLDVQPTDRVLEIGFGPGLAIGELARRATHGLVIGIDRSEVMRAQATRRNADAIRAGRVELRTAAVEDLPDLGGPVDRVLAVNNMGFWTEPTERLRQLRAVMRPGGRIAIVSQPRCPGATADTTARSAQEIGRRLTAAGFREIHVETLALDPPVACVLATAG